MIAAEDGRIAGAIVVLSDREENKGPVGLRVDPAGEALDAVLKRNRSRVRGKVELPGPPVRAGLFRMTTPVRIGTVRRARISAPIAPARTIERLRDSQVIGPRTGARQIGRRNGADPQRSVAPVIVGRSSRANYQGLPWKVRSA